MKKKLLVFVDYDLIIRHFIKTRTFTLLEAVYDVKYVFHEDHTSSKQGVYTNISELNLKNYTTLFVPRTRMGLWDKIYNITALNNQRGTDNYKPRRHLMAKTRGYLRTCYYEVLSSPLIFPIARKLMMNKMGSYDLLDKFLHDEKPDLIIHPSILAGYFINELLLLCPKLNIPLVLLMNSWDNPSVKAMSTGVPDRLVVWGPQTKNHAINYMRMPAERVLEFGAAQFETYREKIAESDLELREMFKVPKGVPIILYGGASKLANETEHLQLLDKQIHEGKIAKCHILYRPHPWRGGLSLGEKSFFEKKFEHVSMDPHMEKYYKDSIDQNIHGFYPQDYSITRKILELVSAVISPLSTILLESIILGKPILMFYPKSDSKIADENLQTAMAMIYFKGFWNCPGIHVEYEVENLSTVMAQIILESSDPEIKNSLQKHAAKFVKLDGPSYQESLLSLAKELIGDKFS